MWRCAPGKFPTAYAPSSKRANGGGARGSRMCGGARCHWRSSLIPVRSPPLLATGGGDSQHWATRTQHLPLAGPFDAGSPTMRQSGPFAEYVICQGCLCIRGVHPATPCPLLVSRSLHGDSSVSRLTTTGALVPRAKSASDVTRQQRQRDAAAAVEESRYSGETIGTAAARVLSRGWVRGH